MKFLNNKQKTQNADEGMLIKKLRITKLTKF